MADLLAIVAHPDDADIFCGGTIAKHADRGDDVTIAHMTRGEYGGFDATEEEIATVREDEATASAETLGAGAEFLGFKDGRIEYSLENRLELVRTIRRHDPTYILTHYGDDMHPDHRTTSELVTDAYYMASLPKVDVPEDPCDVENVYFFGKPTSSIDPSILIDITEYQDRKERAIEHHESQVEFLQEHGGIDAEFDNLLSGVRSEAEALGKRVDARYVEGFAPLHEGSDDYLGE
ncbi:PIG-L deacetylase family protein [Halosimplex sp. J119]